MGATALGDTHAWLRMKMDQQGTWGGQAKPGVLTRRQRFCWRHESELLQEEAQGQLPGHLLPVVPTTGRRIFCHCLVSPFRSMTLGRTPLWTGPGGRD